MIKGAYVFAGALGLSMCAVAPTINAEVVAGWGAFTPVNYETQDCVVHSNGGALNQCGSSQTLIFDLPIDDLSAPTIYSITARSFGSSSSSFQCQAIALNPAATTGAVMGTPVSFAATSAIDTKSFGVTVPSGGWSLRLQCNNVPNNKGILRVRWAPVMGS